MPIKRNAPDASDYYDAEEEETPKTRRRFDEDDDDDDEVPTKARKKSSARRDDDDEEDARPVKKKKRAARDDDDEPPAKKSRRRDDDDEEEEDADELPARSSVVQKGWAAARKAAAEASSEYTDDFRFEEDEQIVKFLDDEPITYKQHWLKQKQGKKSYACIGRGCPLCDELGDTPSYRFAFSVVNFSVEGNPTQVLVAGVRLATLFEKYNNDSRKGPLTKMFWSLSKTGEGRKTQHRVEPVKPRDLADDYDIDPDVVARVLAKREPLDPEKAVQQSTREELTEIADELL